MFPDYNIYSLPLLILVIQGVILALLIIRRYFKDNKASHVILALLIFITCYHRTTYTIGFMGWYDTFRNTKVNYYLVSLLLTVGPLIYYYIKSSIVFEFRFKRKDYLHFVPALIYVLFQILMLVVDMSQPGYHETQNGPFYLWVMENLSPFILVIFTVHLLTYLVLSFRLYYDYLDQLNEEYSNTYKYQLRWLRNFLFVYTFLFLYDVFQNITEGLIFDLHWTQEWWYQFFSVLVVLYVGVMGYFTSLDGFGQIKFGARQKKPNLGSQEVLQFEQELAELRSKVENEQLYLDPNLSLSQLSRKVKISSVQLSQLLNLGAQKNFNDFINEYRVAHVKSQLRDESKGHLSILAIAYDSGFNSKATFNRVFKRLSGQSPSSFRKKITLL